jgi:NADPH2:quinone reductase
MGVHAVVMRAFGPPQVLNFIEVPDLLPGADEVVVDIDFASVTFVETQVRAGRPPNPRMLPRLPAILGNGIGGTVVATGAGIDREGRDALLGRRVIASLSGTGGYAERAVVAADRLIDLPDGVPLRDATALLADGRTAAGLVRRAGLRAGDSVLVEAAAGGVGSLLVQLARNAGARVVALAGGERKVAVARELGAGLAVSYAAPDWASRVHDLTGGVDVVFDGVGGDIGLAAFSLLRAGGRFVPFGMASGAFAPVSAELARERQVSVLTGTPPTPEELSELTHIALTEAAAGRLRPLIGQELDLARASDAHAAIEARDTVGKTLLVVSR